MNFNLPHSTGPIGNRRAGVERKLYSNVRRGSLFSANLNQDGTTYRIVTAGGTEFPKVTLKEADMVCSVAVAAYNEGRAQA